MWQKKMVEGLMKVVGEMKRVFILENDPELTELVEILFLSDTYMEASIDDHSFWCKCDNWYVSDITVKMKWRWVS